MTTSSRLTCGFPMLVLIAQPVLHLVAHDFHSGSGLASLIITATQVGYAAGLLLVVPLGDLHRCADLIHLFHRDVLLLEQRLPTDVCTRPCSAHVRHRDKLSIGVQV